MINKKYFIILTLLVIFLSFLSMLTLKRDYQKVNDFKIGVTIYPFYDITKEIVGDKHEVILIAPPGAEPHNYELKIEDIKKIYGTQIIFANGLSIDEWVNQIIQNFPNIKVVYLYKYVDLIDTDPHFWLSLENIKKIAYIITQELETIDKVNKEYYRDNLQKVLSKIENLQLEIKQLNFKNKHIITQHNAFNYLAKELNLNIVGYLENENKELTISEFRQLIDKIKLFNIKIIFYEPGEESNILNTLAKEYKLKIYELDPIEGKSGLNYFEAYYKNIKTLKELFHQN